MDRAELHRVARGVCGTERVTEQRGGHLAALTALALALGTSVAACSGTGPQAMDAGHYRDGTVIDSTLTVGDATASDAAPADAASAILCAGECDPRDPSACPGEHCVVSGRAECVAGRGDLVIGDACETQDQCAAGLACFADSATGAGVCGEVCCPGDATCGPDRRCGGGGALLGGVTTEWARCLEVRPCDLANPELACAEREGCYIVDERGRTECLIAGTAVEGEPCTQSADCAPGGVCTGLGVKTCARVCLLDMPRECGTERRCEAQAYSPVGTGICTPSVH